MMALHGAVAHALHASDAGLLTRLPDTPVWDRHGPALAGARRTRALNPGPAYESYRALRAAARQVADEHPEGMPPGDATRLLKAAAATRNTLRAAISRMAPVPARAGMPGVEG
jgi:hypothetical protein